MKFEISKTNNIKGEKFMWKNITDTIGNITTVAVQQ
jgi:hypothetical protein